MEHSPLGAVYIFFDTSTYDEIERDVKVVNGFPTKKDLKHRNNFLVFTSSLDILLKLKHDKGDNGSPIGPDWRHNGPSHWLLHPQWNRNHLLHLQVFFIFLLLIPRFFMSLRIARPVNM